MIDSSATSPALAPGALVAERYRVEALLGEGAVGAVYLVRHLHMGKRFALKVLHGTIGDNDEIALRFEREAVAASHIDHVNVAAATDFGRMADGRFYLVLEYVSGRTVRAAMEQGPMGAARAVAIALQIARALAKAHGLGIVHRDLKPENVMLVERKGEPELVKILDFGLAKVPLDTLSNAKRDQPLTRLGAIYGTAGYMAPEQALGEAVDGRADLYALGVMLYEMLTGVDPFGVGDILPLLGKQIAERAPAMKLRAPFVEVPATLEGIVMRLLEAKASDRFQDAKELVAALQGLQLTAREAAAGREPTRVLAPAEATGDLPRPAGNAAAARILAFGSRIVATTAGAWSRAVSWSLPRLGALLVRARSIYERMCRKVPQRWRPGMPWFLISAALAVVGLPIVFLAARGGDEGQVARGNAASLPAASIQQAAQAGAHALENLASEFPEDARIQRELVRVYTLEGRGAAAMRALARLATADPNAAQDDEMNDALVAALDGPNDASMAAIRVAEGSFGARGVDFLLDCSSRAGPAQDRCTQSVAKSEVRAHASPPARVLLELREAKECEEKRAAVEAAGLQGDDRALIELRALNKRTGCGRRQRSDCWPCLRAGRTLENAIATIEARGRAAPVRPDAGSE